MKLGRLWAIVHHRRWLLAAVITLGLISSIFEGIGLSLFIPLLQSYSGTADMEGNLLGRLVSVFSAVPEESRLSVIVLAIFVCILLKCAIQYAGAAAASWLVGDVGHRLRCRIFDQFLALSQTYLEGRQSGQLINTLSNETWRTCQALSILIKGLVSLCTIVAFVTFLLLISWQLTLTVAVALGAIALVVQLTGWHLRRIGNTAVEANKAFAHRMWEALGAMRVIRAFAQEARERDGFTGSSEKVRRTFLKMDLIQALSSPLFETLSALLVLGLIAFTLANDPAALPSLVAFTLLLYRLQPHIRQFISNWISLRSLAGAVDDVSALLEASDKSYIVSGNVPFTGLERRISFDDAGFHYASGETPALSRASFEISAGSVTAIVGPSGAGKSTIVGLLCRFFDPSEGEILVDGRPLPELDLVSWRRRVALVSQDVVLFSSTVAENIAYGRPAATMEEIETAARLADAHRFIMDLPKGYDTPLGDRGVRLSGGQRQRLSLARALLCDPDILILDEATSNLDSRSEHFIQQTIAKFRQGRTIVIISHRLASIEQAEHIVVIDEGRVIEQGDKRALLQKQGLFARLYRLQHQSLEVASRGGPE